MSPPALVVKKAVEKWRSAINMIKPAVRIGLHSKSILSEMKTDIKYIGNSSFWYRAPFPLRKRHVAMRFTLVMMEATVANTNPTKAMSTARPVNRICECGVVKVHPAIVIVKLAARVVAGSQLVRSSATNLLLSARPNT
jgi:hypothetical protein